MEYIMEMAEAVAQQSKQEEEEGSRFKSVFTINGKSILPPLMTPERRLEMQQLRRAAMAIEERGRAGRQTANSPSGAKGQVLQPRRAAAVLDASTNTESESELAQQPLTVVGRLKQQLQQSETLIYDNKCNAIIKLVKSSKLPARQHMVREEYLEAQPQRAVLREPSLVCGVVLSTTLEAAEPTPSQPVPSLRCSPRQRLGMAANPAEMSPPRCSPPHQIQTVRQLLGIAQRLNLSINKRERDLLQRAITSPVLRPRAVPATSGCGSITAHGERLHPQLWKRYHSSVVAQDYDVKQQHSTPEQRSRTASKSALPKWTNSSRSGKPTPRGRSTVSYAAHASSHANARSAPRKVESSSSCGTLLTPKTSPSPSSSSSASQARAAPSGESSTSELIRRRLLDEMEQQQRQRFQQLVSQQAEEQQRLQAEFQAQQQQLMDQMISDMSTLTYDKDGQSDQADQANSESSSISSLPQSRLDLELDEPDSADV
ncbi:probable basic-leucine zipper transcription factor R [Drosophila navojoa]|uniref:probable basic-leucine zipper transcription factor R n=1 Tax=Drosophila navojoa TaxID=7232 RepID=UPI0008477936|nr:probable basic-leucine zipper transcription factor R [Drosophila navojoa]